MTRVESTKFTNLDTEYKRLLGRKSTLIKMIDRRMELLKPILEEVKKIRKELDPLEEELSLIKIKIKEVVEKNDWTPTIIITSTRINGYSYYRGKIRFGKNEKIKLIPKRVENRIKRKLKDHNNNRIQQGKFELSKDEEKNYIKNNMRDWILDWWREEGLLKRK